MIRFEATHKMILLAFPSAKPRTELCDDRSPTDHDLNWCQDALLRVPWSELPLEAVVRNRDCAIYLSPPQLLFCLPAFLRAALVMITDKPPDGVDDCITFFRITITDTSKLAPLTDNLQREAIAEVLEVIAQDMQFYGEHENATEWRGYASWWRSMSRT